MLCDLLVFTPKALQVLAQGQPSDAVARRHPGLSGNKCPALEDRVIPHIAALPRPQNAARRFGLGARGITWWPDFSADASNRRLTQGGVILA